MDVHGLPLLQSAPRWRNTPSVPEKRGVSGQKPEKAGTWPDKINGKLEKMWGGHIFWPIKTSFLEPCLFPCLANSGKSSHEPPHQGNQALITQSRQWKSSWEEREEGGGGHNCVGYWGLNRSWNLKNYATQDTMSCSNVCCLFFRPESRFLELIPREESEDSESAVPRLILKRQNTPSDDSTPPKVH